MESVSFKNALEKYYNKECENIIHMIYLTIVAYLLKRPEYKLQYCLAASSHLNESA